MNQHNKGFNTPPFKPHYFLCVASQLKREHQAHNAAAANNGQYP